MAEVPNTLENEFFMEQLSDILNENETHYKIIELAKAEAGLNEFDGEELASRIEAFIAQEIDHLNTCRRFDLLNEKYRNNGI